MSATAEHFLSRHVHIPPLIVSSLTRPQNKKLDGNTPETCAWSLIPKIDDGGDHLLRTTVTPTVQLAILHCQQNRCNFINRFDLSLFPCCREILFSFFRILLLTGTSIIALLLYMMSTSVGSLTVGQSRYHFSGS